jgi:hypothetical protein
VRGRFDLKIPRTDESGKIVDAWADKTVHVNADTWRIKLRVNIDSRHSSADCH